MKRSLFITVCLMAVMFVSCASNKNIVSNPTPVDQGRYIDGTPQAVMDARNNAPEGSLVGVGTANMASLNMSRTISETRARSNLSRQIDVILKDMVRDYTAESEVDHSAALAFQENIAVQLSQSRLQGSSIVNEFEDERGHYWTIIMMNKTRVVNEIKQAVAAAKLRVPAMASFNAEERMNTALFDKYLNESEIGYSDRD